MNEPSGLRFRVIHSGTNARYQGSARNITYAPAADAYERLWTQMVGETPAPAVDFGREAVLFIIAGQRPTGGYTVDVKNISVKGDTLVVDAPVSAPGPDMMVTQALTSPFAVVVLDKVDVARIDWNGAEGVVDKPRDR